MSQPPRFSQTPYGHSADGGPVGPPIGFGTGPRVSDQIADAGLGEAMFDMSFEMRRRMGCA